MRIGIDLGGTKIEAIALADDGHECVRQRIVSPRGDYAATIEAVAGLVEQVERRVGTASVGVGIPGAVSPATGLIKNANSTWLNGQRLPDDLSRRLQREVRVANDANCFALSEAVDGAGAGHRVVFGVIVGTGTGGGIVIDGQVLAGANAIGGEWGHNPMPWPEPGEWPGPSCYCGRSGCIETFLSGPGLAGDYRAATGNAADAQKIAALADSGEPGAAAAMGRYQSRMARALATIINVVDPDVIVLGGGLSNVSTLYEQVPRLWSRFVFSDRVITRLRPALYGDSSGVRGAAWLGGNKRAHR